jgi:hypothetical protein
LLMISCVLLRQNREVNRFSYINTSLIPLFLLFSLVLTPSPSSTPHSLHPSLPLLPSLCPYSLTSSALACPISLSSLVAPCTRERRMGASYTFRNAPWEPYGTASHTQHQHFNMDDNILCQWAHVITCKPSHVHKILYVTGIGNGLKSKQSALKC